MKIAIDIRAACRRRAGKGYYTQYLVQALLKIDKKNEYILYSNRKSAEFKKIHRVRGRSIFYHLNLLRHLRKDRPDIFFAPTSYIAPALAPKQLKVVFTVHDLVAFIFPNKHEKKATFIERLMLKPALKKAKKVVCVSRNTAKDLCEIFHYPARKTEIIHCAAGGEFKILSSQKTKNVKNKYGLPGKFILAVGTLEPRKNFISLIEAFKSVKDDIKDLHVVIIGTKGWGAKDIYAITKSLRLKDRVKFLGYVEYKDLVKIYNLAEIFIFPSIYEGFGMPPLEAMKCGCPVICSNTSSLPEVVDKAAYMIDPHKEDEIENGIRAVSGDPHFAKHLREKGLQQAKKFSWEKSAEKLLEVFMDVHKGKS